jgi:DnaJ family protein A protein 2
MIPGDVIMIIDPEPHPQFERKGDHLIYTQKITLLEALTGFFFPIVHLDGRTLRVLSEEGRVYKHGETMLISDEGMPTHRNPLLKGHLMVKFDVVFPDRLSVDSQVYEVCYENI